VCTPASRFLISAVAEEQCNLIEHFKQEKHHSLTQPVHWRGEAGWRLPAARVTSSRQLNSTRQNPAPPHKQHTRLRLCTNDVAFCHNVTISNPGSLAAKAAAWQQCAAGESQTQHDYTATHVRLLGDAGCRLCDDTTLLPSKQYTPLQCAPPK
jgi:hypothetical protein